MEEQTKVVKTESNESEDKNRDFYHVADRYEKVLYQKLVVEAIAKDPNQGPTRALSKSLKVNIQGQPLEVILQSDGFGRFNFRAQTLEGKYVSNYLNFGFGHISIKDFVERIRSYAGLSVKDPYRDSHEWGLACSLDEFIKRIDERISKNAQTLRTVADTKALEIVERETVDLAAKAIGSEAFHSVYHAQKGWWSQWKIRNKYLDEYHISSPEIKNTLWYLKMVDAAEAEFKKAAEECLAAAPRMDRGKENVQP